MVPDEAGVPAQESIRVVSGMSYDGEIRDDPRAFFAMSEVIFGI